MASMANRDWTSVLLFIACSLEKFCLAKQGIKRKWLLEEVPAHAVSGEPPAKGFEVAHAARALTDSFLWGWTPFPRGHSALPGAPLLLRHFRRGCADSALRRWRRERR